MHEMRAQLQQERGRAGRRGHVARGLDRDAAFAASGSVGSPMRMEVRQVPGGPVLVVDCFKAIPASAEAALRT
ncbi:MAG TPA: hypothetical protein VFU94_07805 [Conexibacter sp.]|nr:hypothetical protein [Conexibacter sp.]